LLYSIIECNSHKLSINPWDYEEVILFLQNIDQHNSPNLTLLTKLGLVEVLVLAALGCGFICWG